MMHDENDKELFQRPQLKKKGGKLLCLEAYGFFSVECGGLVAFAVCQITVKQYISY